MQGEGFATRHSSSIELVTQGKTLRGRGSILTLHVDGVKDVLLLRGNPVNLFEYRIEVTNLLVNLPYPLCSDEYLDIRHLSSEVRYIEVGRHSETVKEGEAIYNCSTGAKAHAGQNPCND